MSRKVMARVSQMVGVPPAWSAVLAVIAHPDEATLGLDPDEATFGLGAILDAFVLAGTRVEVLCLTHGQAWTLPGAPGDLAALRGAGLASAADVLGPIRAKLSVDALSPIRAKMQDWSDGALCEVCQSRLAAEVVSAADSCHPDGLLVFDTAAATDRLDYLAASAAGLLAAETLDLPVLGWALCETVAAHLKQEFGGSLIAPQGDEIDLRVSLERTRQRVDSRKFQSPARPGSPSWRRLDLLADIQSLRWLRPPSSKRSRTARYRSSQTTSAQEARP
jgi:LmbE family N-acetylglucosaminyl deacetylase